MKSITFFFPKKFMSPFGAGGLKLNLETSIEIAFSILRNIEVPESLTFEFKSWDLIHLSVEERNWELWNELHPFLAADNKQYQNDHWKSNFFEKTMATNHSGWGCPSSGWEYVQNTSIPALTCPFLCVGIQTWPLSLTSWITRIFLLLEMMDKPSIPGWANA